jgi:hypothetical protein
VSAFGAFQKHAVVAEVQQEIVPSNGTSPATNPGKRVPDVIPEMAVIDCRQAKPL